MRVAAIDIGTNTVLLLIAEAGADGSLVAVEERATITRLGQGVDETKELAPDAVERTNACLSEYARAIRDRGVTKIGVVGTSAMRDAKGGEVVRAHVKRELGVEARVISGDEEARMTFAGALSGLTLDDPNVAVFDIGGGSTEIVAGDAKTSAIRFARSFDVGSVRLTERHVRTDPPSDAEMDAIRRDLASTFASVPRLDAREAVGVAGTMTTLAAVAMKMDAYDGARVHGHVLAIDELRRVVAELSKMPLAERRAVSGLEPKRADVIVAGGLIAIAVAEALSASRLRVSDRGVRWGLASGLASGLAAGLALKS